MKALSAYAGKFLRVTYTALTFFLTALALQAQNAETWDNGAGNYTWDTNSLNWSDYYWADGHDAIFSSNGVGTIAVSGTRSVSNLTVSASGYAFSGGTLNVAGAGSTVTWTFSNDTSIASALNVTLSGSGAFETVGGGTYSQTGPLTVNGDSSSGSFFKAVNGVVTLSGDANCTNIFLMPTVSSLQGKVVILGGDDVFTGSTNVARRGLAVNGGATLMIGGGNVTADQLVVAYGSSGIYTQTNGTVTITGTPGTGVGASPVGAQLGAAGNSAQTAVLNLAGGTLIGLGINAGSTWLGKGTINLDGGTFQCTDNNTNLFATDTAGSQTGSILIGQSTSGGGLTNGARIDTAGYNVTQAQPLTAGSPSGGLFIYGGGMLDLTGTNTYTGATVLSNGTLQVDGSLAAGSEVEVEVGGTIGGKGTINGPVTVDGGGIVAVGGGSLGTLTINSNLTFDYNAGAVFRLNTTNASVTNDFVVVNGMLTAVGSTLTVTNLGPALQNGDTFTLFSEPVSGFTNLDLPELGSGLAWDNELAENGGISVTNGSVTAVWTGGGGGDTSIDTAANWGGVNPAFDGTAMAALAAGGSSANLDVPVAFAGLVFNASASFTLSGVNALTNGAGGISAKVPGTTTYTYTIGAPVELGANQTWNVSNNGAGATTLTVSAVISDDGAGYGFIKTGDGTLKLSAVATNRLSLGTNTFGGDIVVSNGVLNAVRYGTFACPLDASGGSTYVNSDGTTSTGGQLILNANGSLMTSDEAIVLEGSGEAGSKKLPGLVAQQGKVTNNAAITLGGSGTYRVQIYAINIANTCLDVEDGIARSGSNSGSLVLELDGSSGSRTPAQLIMNGALDNNGGAVTLAGSNLGVLQLNNSGNDLGAFTIAGDSGGTTHLTTLELGANDALGTNQDLTITAGALDLAGFHQTVKDLTTGTNGTVKMSVNRADAAATNGYLVVNATVSVSGSTLIVTNVGSVFQLGDRVQLFSQAVSGFTSNGLPALGSGLVWTNRVAVDGSIVVTNSAPVPAHWTGNGGADNNVDTAANWLASSNPPFNGTVAATFADDGTNANLDVPVAFSYLVFDANANFNINGTNALTVGAGGIDAMVPGATAYTYSISAPVELATNQVWNVSSNGTGSTTLTIRNVISDGGGGFGLTKTGNGILQLTAVSTNQMGVGTNTFGGNIVVSNGVLTALRCGTQACPLDASGGTTYVNSDGTLSTGGQLILNSFGSQMTLGQPIVIQGTGESGGNTKPGLVAQQGRVTDNGTITLGGTNTYRVQVYALNIANTYLDAKSGITRSGTDSGPLVVEMDGTTGSTTPAQLIMDGSLANNGGSLTLAGSNLGTLVLNTNGNDVGNITIDGNSGSLTTLTTLQLGMSDALATNQDLIVTQGAFNLAGFQQTLGSLTVDENGMVEMSVDKTAAAATNGYLTVTGTLKVNGGTLVVSNAGPDLEVGDRIQLFNQAVSGFAALHPPAGYRWANNVALDGSIVVTAVGTQTYYVSPSGSDTNDGTLGAPLQTLTAAVALLNAGDTLYLRAGTYRTTMTPLGVGTSNAPITVEAYSNEVATLSGCDVITNSWSYLSNGIYSTPVDWDLGEGYNQVFVNGQMQHEAQYPNWTASNDLLNPATVNITMCNNYTVTNTATNGFGVLASLNLSRAYFLGGVGEKWAWQSAAINSNDSKNVYLDSSTATKTWWWPNQGSAQNQPGVGLVYGKLNLLDADGEWYYDSSSGILYLRIAGEGDPGTNVVEMKRRNWCVNIGGNYVTVKGITTRAGAIELNGMNDVLDDCDAGYLSHYMIINAGSGPNDTLPQGGGVVLNGSSNMVCNCVIHDTAGSGINAGGNGEVITNNLIYNIDYAGTYSSGINLAAGAGDSVRFNTIHDGGRDLIIPGGSGHDIEYNDIYDSKRLCLDGGAIYTYDTDAAALNTNTPTHIAYNWIHDGSTNDVRDAGIYFDSGCRNFLVDHNVIWDFGLGGTNRGISINSPNDGTQLYHNTLVNCGAYNTETFNGIPANSSYWATNNDHLYYTAQNNLLLTNATLVDSNLVDASSEDFRLRAGSGAIDPTTTTNIVSWCTTNGDDNVPLDFSLGGFIAGVQFCYQEVAGQGVVVSNINDGYLGATPDSGAYEYGGPYWHPGTNGWTVEPPYITTDPATNVGSTNATLNGTLVSAGLSPATVEVFWDTNEMGTSVSGWANSATVGTNYGGSFTNLSQVVEGLLSGGTYYYRFYATNNYGESWGDVQTLTTLSGGAGALVLPGNSPVSYTMSASAYLTCRLIGDKLVLNWPAGQGWRLQAQTNSLEIGLNTNWSDVAGATPPYTNAFNRANSVFYRLVFP